jgi:predicted PurR-regulated permease PerM
MPSFATQRCRSHRAAAQRAAIRSNCRHIRPADVLFSLFRVAHSHPDHHGVAPEHAIGTHCAPARVGALFGIAASLSGPAQSWLTEPQRFSRLEEKLGPLTVPFGKLQYATEQVEKATAPRDVSPIQKVEVTRPGLSGLISNGSGHVVSTIAAVVGLVYLFLVSRDTFLRKLVLVTPSLKDKKRAVEIVRNIESDISFYLVLVAAINIEIGFVVTATTGALGISDPLLWGTLAAVLSFAPYVGEFVIVIILSLAGILTFDNLVQAFVAPAI